MVHIGHVTLSDVWSKGLSNGLSIGILSMKNQQVKVGQLERCTIEIFLMTRN